MTDRSSVRAGHCRHPHTPAIASQEQQEGTGLETTNSPNQKLPRRRICTLGNQTASPAAVSFGRWRWQMQSTPAGHPPNLDTHPTSWWVGTQHPGQVGAVQAIQRLHPQLQAGLLRQLLLPLPCCHRQHLVRSTPLLPTPPQTIACPYIYIHRCIWAHTCTHR